MDNIKGGHDKYVFELWEPSVPDYTTRISNSLARLGISRVGQLLKRQPYELLKIHGFGKGCLSELERVLAANGYELGSEIEYTPPEQRNP